MITESALEILEFNKIVWNNRVAEYWLPLRKPTGDQIKDMDCRLGVRFNEFKDEPGPIIYLVVHGTIRLPHIEEMGELIQLYELLAEHSFWVGDG